MAQTLVYNASGLHTVFSFTWRWLHVDWLTKGRGVCKLHSNRWVEITESDLTDTPSQINGYLSNKRSLYDLTFVIVDALL